MPHPNKKQKLDANHTMVATDNDDNEDASFDSLSVDEIALIFGYLTAENIMFARLSRNMRDAAIKTVVPMNKPLSELCRVYGVDEYNALAAMATALPNVQQIEIGSLGSRHKYNDGEDPNAMHPSYADRVSLDISVLFNFKKLQKLKIENAPLNGRYPSLFTFPLLEKLNITWCHNLKWDLEMLAGLPSLKKLKSVRNKGLTGNIKSLRALSRTLVKIQIDDSPCVQGNFFELADFPRLTLLSLDKTAVTGDIREIGEGDFPSLEMLSLPPSVYGGRLFEFLSTSDAPRIAADIFKLLESCPKLLQLDDWFALLSCGSPEWYEGADPSLEFPQPPLYIVVVMAGPRRGWRWEDVYGRDPCEMNWLDPEPEKGSSEYEIYVKELESINQRCSDVYRGYLRPPTENEYLDLVLD